MDNLDKQLAAHPFFEGITVEQLGPMLPYARHFSVEVDGHLFRAQEAADQFYLLCTGSVALKVHVPQLGPIPIQTIRGGEALGWSWLVPPYRWHFDARAIEPLDGVALAAEGLRKLIDERHELGYLLLRRMAMVMAHRLQATRLQLLDVYEARA